MKRIIILIITFTTLLTLSSCENADKIKFYGQTVTVDYPKHTHTLTNGKTLNLEGEYTGLMYAYDGVLMFSSDKHPDGYLYLYDVETGRRISAICKKGGAPNEIYNFRFYDNFEKDSNGLHLWICAIDNRKLIRVNMQGEFEETIHTAKFKSSNEFGIGTFFILSDSSIIAYMQGYALFEDGPECVAPSYRVYNLKTGETIQDYKFYSDYTAGTADREILRMWPEFYLTPISKIKLDKSKLAMAMLYVGRRNRLQ